MEEYRRFAIYWAPPRASALWRFGASWLGWDAETGEVPEPPATAPLPLPREEIVARPRRYGFHATLKAPFALAPGRSAAELDAALADLAARIPAFDLPRLRLAEPAGFLALMLDVPSAPLAAVEAACLRELDIFRAPMTPEERDRRAQGLTARQRAYLDKWGYPLVLDEFRFHLTLSDRLPDGIRRHTASVLRPVLAPILAEGQRFHEIALFAEPQSGPFRLIRRYPLA